MPCVYVQDALEPNHSAEHGSRFADYSAFAVDLEAQFNLAAQ